MIDKFKILVRKNVVLDHSYKNQFNELISVDNIELLTPKDPTRVLLPSVDEVLKMVTAVSNSVFPTTYVFRFDPTQLGFGSEIPTAEELTYIYDAGGLIVEDTNGNTVTLMPGTANEWKDGEGIFTINELTGTYEEAGMVAGNIVIDQTKNSLPQTLAGLDSRITINESDIDDLEAEDANNVKIDNDKDITSRGGIDRTSTPFEANKIATRGDVSSALNNLESDVNANFINNDTFVAYQTPITQIATQAATDAASAEAKADANTQALAALSGTSDAYVSGFDTEDVDVNPTGTDTQATYSLAQFNKFDFTVVGSKFFLSMEDSNNKLIEFSINVGDEEQYLGSVADGITAQLDTAGVLTIKKPQGFQDVDLTTLKLNKIEYFKLVLQTSVASGADVTALQGQIAGFQTTIDQNRNRSLSNETAIVQLPTALGQKQNRNDNTLQTQSKYVADAINEVNAKTNTNTQAINTVNERTSTITTEDNAMTGVKTTKIAGPLLVEGDKAVVLYDEFNTLTNLVNSLKSELTNMKHDIVVALAAAQNAAAADLSNVNLGVTNSGQTLKVVGDGSIAPKAVQTSPLNKIYTINASTDKATVSADLVALLNGGTIDAIEVEASVTSQEGGWDSEGATGIFKASSYGGSWSMDPPSHSPAKRSSASLHVDSTGFDWSLNNTGGGWTVTIYYIPGP